MGFIYNKKKWPRTQDLLNTYILNSAALLLKGQSILNMLIDFAETLPIICELTRF